MDEKMEEGDVRVDTGVEADRHTHDWRVVEVDFSDGAALRVFECACGASDVDAAA